ncbi:MAG: Ni/Fe hydrogenase subunit alpha [Candidatus Marinimicrobia bacterium]|nr:Ni/Fe hydrogenase subunit alpha [Candidatus Neomarinimicrobiota bacterium]MCF7827825.1 Ni/Fe hydrogenase subunit alpha [Candidatus Neomarinimicrobiota bacterium]MCF7879420.1 Ni/Fe hydrogenase subunit alpha [Candidatus Neomarinimicrobiota bacterium]
MAEKITIDPVTRIEGHGKITIHLDKYGYVDDAQFHVTQFRGFEKLVEGRPFQEMPSIMARICGICPVSHLIAGAKAGDAIMAVQIPETAVRLREILNLAQLVQSHALNFFHLSSPDFVLGMDSDPAKRNIFGVIESDKNFAKDGIRLRQFGQQIIEKLGGKRIHSPWVVPGGVNEPLTEEVRDEILTGIPEAMEIAQRVLVWFKQTMEDYRDEMRTFANFPTKFLSLVNAKGELEHYDGMLRVVNAAGKVVEEFHPEHYQTYIGEAVEPWSYLKFPYFKPDGYPDGIYRVGPLARLNTADGCGTPLADQEWTEFRELERGPVVLSSFHYHYARLIEILHGLEKIESLLQDDTVLSDHHRAFAGPNNREGIGVSEAPRGTLIHHYKIDGQGLITDVNLIIATGHNNLAMNRGILQVAKQYVKSDELEEGMLNRVEAVVRAFDPCLSCSTHAAGQMPLDIQLINSDGERIDRLVRD